MRLTVHGKHDRLYVMDVETDPSGVSQEGKTYRAELIFLDGSERIYVLVGRYENYMMGMWNCQRVIEYLEAGRE